MKRFLILLLAVLMMLSLGCSKPEEEVAETNLIRIGFSQTGAESDWRIAHTNSIVEALCEANGCELLMDNARQKQENQFLAIRTFIQEEVDYIILAPVSEYGWENVLREAKDAGIPVILVDRKISVSDDSLYVSWIGSDFYKEGERAAQWLDDYLWKERRDHEKIRILHLQGTENSTSQLMRTKALNDAVARQDLWSICAVLKGEYVEAKTYELVRDYLTRDTDFDVIYSENDNMTFGAIRALDEAGITYGANGDVIIISFDATKAALYDCINQKIDLCVECNPLHGPDVLNVIQLIEQGMTPPRRNFVNETTYTPGSLIPELVAIREY